MVHARISVRIHSFIHVPSIPYLLCSCGLTKLTAKHIMILCSIFSAAGHALRHDQERLPDFKQLLTTPTGLQLSPLARTGGPGASSTH
jgi:hypothetical protein